MWITATSRAESSPFTVDSHFLLSLIVVVVFFNTLSLFYGRRPKGSQTTMKGNKPKLSGQKKVHLSRRVLYFFSLPFPFGVFL